MRKKTFPNIYKEMEKITSEICDHYCRYPDEYYQNGENEDDYTERLVEERCVNCPLVQFLSN